MNFVNMVSIWKRTGKERYPATLFILLFAFFLFPQESNCEFYKYVDKNGKIHFVDSKTKIPKEYRKDLTSYDEKYDHLSEEERDKNIEEDRKKREVEREEKEERQRRQEREWEEQRRGEEIHKETRQEEQEKTRLEEERREKERTSQKEFLKNFITKVEIKGYQVLVPCKLVYNKQEVEAKLLLDTGCSITTIHSSVANKLRMKGGKKGKATIAGGGSLALRSKQLDSIKVGPHKFEDFAVDIIKNTNRKDPMEGMLGMNFLAGLPYNIDYVHKVIRWSPY